MMIDVHLRDGQTVVRCASRSALATLIQRDVVNIEGHRPLRVWIDRGQAEGFALARVQYIAKGSIAWIEQIAGETRDRFLTQHDPGLLAHFQAKEAEHRQHGDTTQAVAA